MSKAKVLQMGVAYAQSLLAFHADRSPKPFSASFAVTNKCNLRCVYCNCPLLKIPELNLEQIEQLFGKLKKMGVVRLGLFGGEPLVRKDIGEIVDLAKSLGFFVSFNSNLLLYERYKDRLDGVDYFFTSLDGTPEKHLANRGKHNLDVVHAAMNEIIRKGQKLTAICVVTDADFEGADYLIDLAQKGGFDLHFQQECYDAENAGRSAPDGIEQSRIREFWHYLLKRKREGAPITSSEGYLKYITTWPDFRSTAMYDPNTKCAAGRGFLFVDSSGETYPCPYTKGIVKPVNLMEVEWADAFDPNTPCTKCLVGPMLETNLLFHNPVSSVMSAMAKV